MTDEMIALARRAVACRGWRWIPGMKLTTGLRLTESLVWLTYPVDLPDLTDPATLGCLLALVREAWGDDEAYAIPWHDEDGGWTVCVHEEDRSVSVSEGDTETEALVAALELAP